MIATYAITLIQIAFLALIQVGLAHLTGRPFDNLALATSIAIVALLQTNRGLKP